MRSMDEGTVNILDVQLEKGAISKRLRQSSEMKMMHRISIESVTKSRYKIDDKEDDIMKAKQVYPADIHGTTLDDVDDDDVIYKNNNVHEKKPDSRPKSKSTKKQDMSKFNRTALRRANDTRNNKNYETYQYIQGRIYLLSAIIGDTQAPYNSIKGYIGRILWILNICIHFSLDFYEATVVFHVSWASSIGLYFFMFVSCTYFIIKHSVRWYIKVVRKLSQEKIYDATLAQIKFIFKVSPFLLAVLSVTGAAAQYGCYAYDGATKLTFKRDRFVNNFINNYAILSNSTSSNSTNHVTSSLNITEFTNPVPESVEILINIVRFTSLSHIYYMMFLMLIFNVIVFFTVLQTQKSFNAHIGAELKSHPPKMTFQQAVGDFAIRTKLLRGASENTTAVLSILLIATSVSFVVNAYNFLFIKRYAIYVWFAIAPLIWLVVPLIGAALVTSTYQKLKFIVIQSWVEIPEKYDEIWHKSTMKDAVGLPHPNWRAGLENMRRKRAEREEEERRNSRTSGSSFIVNIGDRPSVEGKRKKSLFNFLIRQPTVIESPEVSPAKEARNTPSPGSSTSDGSTKILHVNNDTKENNEPRDIAEKTHENIQHKTTTENMEMNFEKQSRHPLSKSRAKTFTAFSNPKSPPEASLLKRTETNSTDTSSVDHSKPTTQPKLRNRFANVVRLAQRIERFKKTTQVRNRFNYEKYIKFLELTLDTIGFSVGKVTITWDRVSFFIILLLSLVGVFAQSAFLR